MGSRDIRHREAKKPKKDAKKPAQLDVLQPISTQVEVIKTKGKKPREEEEEEEE